MTFVLATRCRGSWHPAAASCARAPAGRYGTSGPRVDLVQDAPGQRPSIVVGEARASLPVADVAEAQGDRVRQFLVEWGSLMGRILRERPVNPCVSFVPMNLPVPAVFCRILPFALRRAG